MRLNLISVITAIFLVGAGLAAACDNPQSPDISCSSAVTTYIDNNGQLWAAYVVGEHLWVGRSADFGASFSTPARVNAEPETISARGENRPKIAAHGENVMLSWARPGNKRFTADIRFTRSLDGGKTFEPVSTLNKDGLEIGHSFNAMTLNDKGRLLIAWLDGRERHAAESAGEKFHGSSLFHTWSDDFGATFAPEQPLVRNTCECCRVAMDTDRRGRSVLAWRHVYYNNGARDHAIGRVNQVGQPVQMNRLSFENWQIDGCPHHGPDLDVDIQGRVHTVWFSGSQHAGGLWYQALEELQPKRYVELPEKFGDAKKLAAHPQVRAAGDCIARAWQEFDGEQTTIRVQMSLNGGTTWSAPRTIASTKNTADYPFLLAHGERLFLSWLTADEGYQFVELTDSPA